MQTTAPGVSVAQVALRYTVNANLIFKWLRDPKYRPAPGTGSEEAGLRFLPVEIVKEALIARPMPFCREPHRDRTGGWPPDAHQRWI